MPCTTPDIKVDAVKALGGAAHGQRLAAVVSGANMNFDRLRFVAERASSAKGGKRCSR